MINLLHRNDKFFAAHKKFPKIPLGNSCTKIAYFFGLRYSWHFFVRTAASKSVSEQFAWCTQLCFVNFALRPTQQFLKELGLLYKELYLGKHLELDI